MHNNTASFESELDELKNENIEIAKSYMIDKVYNEKNSTQEKNNNLPLLFNDGRNHASNETSVYEQFEKETSEDIDINQVISSDTVSILKAMMKDENYESGVPSTSEVYFQTVYEKDRLIALNSISRLFMDNFNSDSKGAHYLIGVLHIISHFNYEEVYPTGQMIAISAIGFANSVEVQEYGVKCFENWEHKDGINKLKAISFSAKWLQEYANEVIEELERKI